MIQYDRNRRCFAVALAALAGCVDSIGFLSANGYFVSFMSGNTTRLGVALGSSPRHALVPALLIGGFIVGVTTGSLIATAAGRWRKPAITALVTALLLCGAAARVLGAEPVMLGTLVMAMGAINNTFQRGGEVAIGLTYMTGALVKLGQGLAQRLAGRPTPGWGSWAWLWGGLLTGAVTGAFLEDRLPRGCLWLAAGWAAIMVVVAFRLPVES